ncbi:alpha/beta hydrolase family protein [Eubacterium xylanophilum]|uniref:alpha/beta hydrolase family protein n=1 Tax=Eubacterium xylanophilum TaxID=39497 RepID=UPI00047ACBE1|nr:alpha/beta fold hydrolase [Eubacterium xylanophilum]MCR5796540.1 lysophospholipase [Eubacterium sp.]
MKEFFIDSDGTRLHAKLDMPEGVEQCPLCVLIHGFTGHMEEDHIVTVQKAMNDVGIAVLRVEMYGHGESDGEFYNHTLYKWVTNALAAVKYAGSLEFATELYLSGHSQGGLLTMLVGGMCPDYFAGIIPLSPAWNIPEGTRQGNLLGIQIDPRHIPEKIIADDWEISGDYVRVAQTIHVEDEIARYDGPVYIVHGMDDEIIPYSFGEEAERLYKNAKLVGIGGANHCFDDHLDDLAEAVRGFWK